MIASLPLIAAAIPVQAQVANAPISKAQSTGTLENGVYKDKTGVQFTLPPDWAVVSHARASDGAHTVMLRDTITNVIATVWLKSRTVDPASTPALMSRRLDTRLAQRNNFEGYKFRPESVQNTTIGGRPALSAVADYVRTGQKMVEYLTWIDGETSRVAFVARMPASELADFQGRFDAVTQSALVP
ncbi:MAG: hypothetical protein ABSF54_04695 [Bryobacteraceae bacterium]